MPLRLAAQETAYYSSYGSSVADGLSATKVKDPVTSQVAATLGTASKGARASLTSNCENAPEECWAHSVCESLKTISGNSQSARLPNRRTWVLQTCNAAFNGGVVHQPLRDILPPNIPNLYRISNTIPGLGNDRLKRRLRAYMVLDLCQNRERLRFALHRFLGYPRTRHFTCSHGDVRPRTKPKIGVRNDREFAAVSGSPKDAAYREGSMEVVYR